MCRFKLKHFHTSPAWYGCPDDEKVSLSRGPVCLWPRGPAEGPGMSLAPGPHLSPLRVSRAPGPGWSSKYRNILPVISFHQYNSCRGENILEISYKYVHRTYTDTHTHPLIQTHHLSYTQIKHTHFLSHTLRDSYPLYRYTFTPTQTYTITHTHVHTHRCVNDSVFEQNREL